MLPKTMASARPLRAATVILGVTCAGPLAAQTPEPEPSYSLYGVPGLIDMPTAESAADAELALTFGGFPGDFRTTLTFQALPFLSGSFRLVRVDQNTFSGSDDTGNGTTSDRNFDIRFRLFKEGTFTPSFAVGLQDFAGTGKYAAEYLVATKTFGNLSLTAGVGWGRFGTNNSPGSTGTRSNDGFEAEGGVPSADDWFQGPYAPFGGLEWKFSDQFRFKTEYSSDAYENAVAGGSLDRDTSWNFGFDYRFENGTQLSLYSLYGSEIGAQVTFVFNPKNTGTPSGLEEAPLPLLPRNPDEVNDLAWLAAPQVDYVAKLQTALDRDGLTVEGLQLSARKATLRFGNVRFEAEAQAVGRASRAMARTLPASIEVFELVPMAEGLALSTITVRRSDLEAYEFRAAADLRPRVAIADAFATVRPVNETAFPRYSWTIAPYLQTGLFDVDEPLRADVGVRASAAYRPTINTKLSGAVTSRLIGNLDDTPADNSGGLPPVRTNFPIYLDEGYPGIEYLTYAVFNRPGPDLFSRVSVGYLESMFGGISGELLWKPVDSRLALGASLSYVGQRDFDRLFGFQDYDVTTGFLSTYYEIGNGFQGQVDAGRYLAGDVGATFALNREFNNGWVVGAFATFTDASAEEFGEGSFDKGIILTIPTSYVLGTADRSSIQADLRPILRNGGARLNLRDRLYPIVRDYDEATIDGTFGRFWR